MIKDKIMRLADAYADNAYNDGVLRLDHADDRTAASRAALEAALIEKQEPVAWWDSKLGVFDEKHFDQLQPLYTHPAQVNQQEPVIVDCPFCMHSYQLNDAVTHPAPVNQQLLAERDYARERIAKLEKALGDALFAFQYIRNQTDIGHIHETARAAIAAAEGKV